LADWLLEPDYEKSTLEIKNEERVASNQWDKPFICNIIEIV